MADQLDSYNNLSAILQASIANYSEAFSRKGRIEAKISGINTLLSLLFSASLVVFLFLKDNIINKSIIFHLSLLITLFGQCYFMVCSIVASTIGFKSWSTNNILLDDILLKWNYKTDEFLGGLSQTLHDASKENKKINRDLEFYFSLSRCFMLIVLFMFSVFMLISFFSFFGG